GPLLQRGRVDLAITGADRITRRGEVLSTVGTYLQALAAKDNGVAFYVAAPSSAIAWELHDGFTEMPLEEHGAPEVTWIHGQTADGHFHTVRVVPAPSPVAHYASDITRAALITGLITERGLCEATELALGRMFGK
ncbi:MAG: S-methyl-5-thioribose-1-phosphate isomerase, partial [Roseimicrobium sp.]